MTCRSVLDRVEAFAALELEPDAEVRRHLETCPGCAAALAAARRIETFLAAWPAPEAPARFTAAVQHRIRRLHWQAEQRVDQLFNGAMLLAGVLVLAGVAAMFNLDVLLGLARALTDLTTVAAAAAAEKAAPARGIYLAALGLLASALVMWWWSEGSFER